MSHPISAAGAIVAAAKRRDVSATEAINLHTHGLDRTQLADVLTLLFPLLATLYDERRGFVEFIRAIDEEAFSQVAEQLGDIDIDVDAFVDPMRAALNDTPTSLDEPTPPTAGPRMTDSRTVADQIAAEFELRGYATDTRPEPQRGAWVVVIEGKREPDPDAEQLRAEGIEPGPDTVTPINIGEVWDFGVDPSNVIDIRWTNLATGIPHEYQPDDKGIPGIVDQILATN